MFTLKMFAKGWWMLGGDNFNQSRITDMALVKCEIETFS